jgi:YVTN family beta-propeller protein
VLSTVNLRDPDSDLDFFYAIAAGEGAIWVSGAGDDGRPDNLVRYEPTTGVTSATDLGAWLGSLAVGGGSVWAANLDADEIVRVDPATNRVVDAIGVGRIPSSFAVGPEAVWVASKRDGTVTRVDPSTADLKTIDVGGIPIDVAVGASAIWVAVDAE